METLSAPIILVINLIHVWIVKVTLKNKTKLLAFLPLISCVLGAIMGVVAFYVAPNWVPVKDVANALIMGVFSGLSAVGSSEMIGKI